MDYIPFGRNGVKVSLACMGTMTFGRQADESASQTMVRMCLDAGVNFFDTANAYNGGVSEEILGRALKGARQKVVISSKVFGGTGDGPNDRGLSRLHILRAAEDSLRRLGTDYLDVYLLHAPDYTVPLEETLSAMDALVRSGKVRYVGCSNFAAWQLTHALWTADRRDFVPLTVIQPMYNLIARQPEQELFPACREFGVGVMVYNPLAGGLLTGKYSNPDDIPTGTRFDLYDFYRDRYWNRLNFQAVQRFQEIADDIGKNLIEFSIQWCLNHPAVHATILGASKPEQLEESLKAFRLSRLEMQFPPNILLKCDAVWERVRGTAPRYHR